MNSKFGSTLHQSSLLNYDNYHSDDRPTTPLYLLQQSGEDAFNSNLRENVELYFSKFDPSLLKNLHTLLLPKDVNYYFTETQKVTKAVDKVFSKEKAQLDQMIDEYLKQIVFLFEKFKGDLFKVIDDEKVEFLGFYESFRNTIQKFLDESKIKLETSVSEHNAFVNNIRINPEDPFQNQIMRLKVDQQKSQNFLNVFQDIQSSFNSSPIQTDKKFIEKLMLETEERKSKVEMGIVSRSLRTCVDVLASRLRDLPVEEPSKRPMSPIQTAAVGLNRPLSPNLWDKLNPDKLGKGFEKPSGLKNTLPTINTIFNKPKVPEKTEEAKEKKVRFALPGEEAERPGSGQKPKGKFPLVTLNSVTHHSNNNYINIYNHQEIAETAATIYSVPSKKNGPEPKQRPSSVNTQTLKPLGASKLNSSFTDEKESKPFSSVISVQKTNLLSKTSQIKPNFGANLLVNDYSGKISCFDVDTRKKYLIYGTIEGLLVRCTISEPANSIKDEKKLTLPAPILFMNQISSNYIVVCIEKTGAGLVLIDLDGFNLIRTFKTYNEKIKLLGYYDQPRFIAISAEDKILIFDANKENPKKSFKLLGSPIIDVCFASDKVMYSGSENGEIRFFAVNFASDTLTVQGSLKIESKIVSLDVFYNNERLLIVNTKDSHDQNAIYIINAQSNKVMNYIKQISNDGHIYSILTFTVVKKNPDIFLLSFKDNQIFYCDIDNKELKQQINHGQGEALHFRDDLAHKVKLVKILSNDSSASLVAWCTNGIKLVKFY